VSGTLRPLPRAMQDERDKLLRRRGLLDVLINVLPGDSWRAHVADEIAEREQIDKRLAGFDRFTEGR